MAFESGLGLASPLRGGAGALPNSPPPCAGPRTADTTPYPEWVPALFAATGASKRLHSESYRDAPLPGVEAQLAAAARDLAAMRAALEEATPAAAAGA